MANSARKLIIPNPSINQVEGLTISTDYATGTTLVVESNANVSANQILLVDGYGGEKSELGIVSSTSGNTNITLSSALKFSHVKGTPIYVIEFNQIDIDYYSTSWTSLGQIGIQADKKETIYIHSGGTNSYSYRFRFYNSASGNYSEYSPSVGGAGYSKNQIGYLVELVQRKLKDPNQEVLLIDEIINYLCDAKNIIKSRKSDWYFWKKEDEGTITTVADTFKYNLDDISTNIEYIDYIRFRDQSGSQDLLYRLDRKPDYEFDRFISDQDRSSDDHVISYRLLPGDSGSTSGYIECYPTPENTGNGSFYPKYYEPDADFDSLDDTTNIPLPFILTYLPIAEGLRLKGMDEEADKYETRFYGPPSGSKKQMRLTGIALLENMHKDKLKSQGEPKYIKRYLGRRSIAGIYDNGGIDRDSIAEDYFDYPRR